MGRNETLAGEMGQCAGQMGHFYLLLVQVTKTYLLFFHPSDVQGLHKYESSFLIIDKIKKLQTFKFHPPKNGQICVPFLPTHGA